MNKRTQSRSDEFLQSTNFTASMAAEIVGSLHDTLQLLFRDCEI